VVTAVPATITYDAVTRIGRLTPTSPLTAATTYTATVKGGAAGVTDAAGNALAADLVWSFTTIDTTPPTITTRSPAVNAVGVGASAVVTATFSEAMASATITTTTMTL